MLRTLWKTLALVGVERRYRWFLLVLLALSVSLLEAVGAFLVFFLLTLITEPGSDLALPVVGSLKELLPNSTHDARVVVVCIAIAAFFLLRGFIYMFQSYVQNRVANNAGAEVARRLLHVYLKMPYLWHVRSNSAQLIRNIGTTSYELVLNILVPTIGLISEALLVLGILGILLLKAPFLTLMIAGVLAPLVAVLARVIHPTLVAHGDATYRLQSLNLQSLQQSLNGIRDIKVLGKESFFLTEFVSARREIARRSYLRSVFFDVPRVAIETTVMLVILGFLAVTMLTRGSGSGTLAILGLFAYAVLRLMPSMNRILTSMNSLKFGTSAVEGLHEHMSLETTEEFLEEAAPLEFSDQIVLENIDFRYEESERPVLEDIDLVIQKGESVGIVGPTGSGKSTLVDLLVGLLHPDRGRIVVDEVDIRENVRGWQANCGVVPQSIFLLDDSLRRNIALGVPEDLIDQTLLDEAVAVAQLAEFVSTLPDGLETRVGERGVRLSGGQRQRLAIARALYRRPSVFIFDEGTSALDNVTERRLITALEEAKGDRTIISVAHRITTVRDYDRIVVLQDGRITGIGTYDQLQSTNQSFRRMTR